MSWIAPRTWTTGEAVTKALLDEQIRDNENFLKVNIALEAAVELTIAAGVVTKTRSNHTIDTAADAASDDLDTISGGAEGEVLFIRPANDARTIIVKHDTGNIWNPGRIDILLDDADDVLILKYTGSKWCVVGGGSAADLAAHLVAYNHSNIHANTNDPTADEKAALAGTSGTPSGTNKYVTDADSRMDDDRNPIAHASDHAVGATDTLFPADPGADRYLKWDDDIGELVWAASMAGSGDVATDEIWDAKGDLAVGTGADASVRLPVGSNGKVLTADDNEATGLKWATPTGGSGGDETLAWLGL